MVLSNSTKNYLKIPSTGIVASS